MKLDMDCNLPQKNAKISAKNAKDLTSLFSLRNPLRSFAVKLFALALVFCCSFFLAAQEAARQVIYGLKLPLKRHTNGKTEIFLSADKASFNADTISAEGNINVVMLSETGATNGTIRALKGEFD